MAHLKREREKERERKRKRNFGKFEKVGGNKIDLRRFDRNYLKTVVIANIDFISRILVRHARAAVGLLNLIKRDFWIPIAFG